MASPEGFPAAGPRLIVALAADYANIGDVALTRALLAFAAKHAPRHRACLLPADRLFHELRGMTRHPDADDIVAVVGGCNLGDLYPDLEEARLQVVKAPPATASPRSRRA